jgi:sugar-phosphatase
VINGKPAPDIFLVAAERLGFEGSQALVFEDASSGVLAGLAAGSGVIWVPDVKSEPCQILQTRCKKVLYSLEDFNPEEFGL